MNLPLEVVPSPVVCCFFGVMTRWIGFFKEGFGRREMRFWTQLSMKAPVPGGDFSPGTIKRSILTTGESKKVGSV